MIDASTHFVRHVVSALIPSPLKLVSSRPPLHADVSHDAQRTKSKEFSLYWIFNNQLPEKKDRTSANNKVCLTLAL